MSRTTSVTTSTPTCSASTRPRTSGCRAASWSPGSTPTWCSSSRPWVCCRRCVGTVLQVVLALVHHGDPLAPAGVGVVRRPRRLVAVARRLHMRVYAASWDAQQREADMTTVAEEAITGVRVVKGFGQEQAENRPLRRVPHRDVPLAGPGDPRSGRPCWPPCRPSPLAGQVARARPRRLARPQRARDGRDLLRLPCLPCRPQRFGPDARDGPDARAPGAIGYGTDRRGVRRPTRRATCPSTYASCDVPGRARHGAGRVQNVTADERGAFVTFDHVPFSYPDGPRVAGRACASTCSPARRSRSSAPPDRASRRPCNWCRGCATSPPAGCCSTASTSAT